MIFIKGLKDCTTFQAGDESTLCDLLHLDREKTALQMEFGLAHALVKPGQSTLPHELKTSAKFFYILPGRRSSIRGMNPPRSGCVHHARFKTVYSKYGRDGFDLFMPGESSLER